jgi:hypothetical protein
VVGRTAAPTHTHTPADYTVLAPHPSTLYPPPPFRFVAPALVALAAYWEPRARPFKLRPASPAPLPLFL